MRNETDNIEVEMDSIVGRIVFIIVIISSISGENCIENGCPSSDAPCCSKFGYCGNTNEYCDVNNGCQSGCHLKRNTTQLFHHCITFRYRPEVTQDEIDSVTKAYIDVQKKALINGTEYVEIRGGRTISTEGVQSNFRNGFILTFKSDQDRDYFMCCEQAHKDFGNYMGQFVTQKDYNVGFDFQEEIYN